MDTGAFITFHAELTLSLPGHPTATPAIFPFEYKVRICGTENFSGPTIVVDTIIVGVTNSFDLDIEFDQSPCMYGTIYEVRLYSPTTGLQLEFPNKYGDAEVLPQFMTHE
jgi:hypothetical protein